LSTRGGIGSRSAAGVCIGVADYSHDIVLVCVIRAVRIRDGAQPERIRRALLIRRHEDVVALADAHVERGGIIRRYGHEVCGYDLHDVVVDADCEERIDGCVDEAEAVSLPWLESGGPSLAGGAEDVHAVDEAVVHLRRLPGVLGGLVQSVCGGVGPVLHDYGAGVDVVVGGAGAVDDDGAEDAVPGLEGEVADGELV